MIWKSLKMPRTFQKTEVSENGHRAKFEIEALERGWGMTIGNALRRTLLSSIQGAAIVSVKIDKVDKEYASIPGVREDVTDIILNLKTIRFKLLGDKEETLRLDVSGEGNVSAKNIDTNPGVVILNPDTHIATLSGNASLCVEMKVSSGRGYVPADDPDRKRAAENAPVGEILIDANFNPVLNVAMLVSDARVEERTDFNRLELDITTDGSIDPEDALAYAAKLLVDHLEIFINFEGDLDSSDDVHRSADAQAIVQKLLLKVEDLELSVRSSNCLRQAGIHTIADLVRNKEVDMLKHKNFGRKSLVELNDLLTSMSLNFGMDVDAYLKDNGGAE
ncbi:MAG: DNA-directed RNA polymerase subunit alpha [Fibromonadaceae bacterium]|jgi:DNA-directed RNA polymerase subunit alpha|nr:DNA-directed RNA polymerase subunit alpha [Fibromonadaceae bacterium]